MSFDIFLDCFRNGESSSFPRELLEEAFGSLVEGTEGDDFWLLPDGCTVDIDSDEDGVSGFSVNRPPGGPEFWQGMLSILQKTTSVLYWEVAVVGQTATITELPPGMIEAFGTPTLVRSPDEITEIIRNN
jgi:hypothetical protein